MKKLLLLFFSVFALHFQQHAQVTNSDVTIVGAMKNVMWKGELEGTIFLDTLLPKQHLYGIGPVEYLSGEILILNGKSYVSKVVAENEITVIESFEKRAPFFVYSTVEKWEEIPLPNSINSLNDLEKFLDNLTQDIHKPFTFKLEGTVKEASIHVVNLPTGSTVSSPDEAHEGQINYELSNEFCTIIGFFSREHQSIFTHHDTFMHLHLITNDLKKMGHLDNVSFDKIKLFIAN